MTENEKQAIGASFAGKRVSQMTELERKVFDEDFQYGVESGSRQKEASRGSTTKPSIWRRMGFSRK